MQRVRLADSFARDNPGSSKAAIIAMMAMTTNNSIRVKPITESERAARKCLGWPFMWGCQGG